MNSQQLSKLSILPPDKTVVFYSPIEGKDVLVRTGTVGDGSCFVHGLLHAYSKDYAGLDRHGREKLVSKLRRSMADKLDQKRWENISSGLVAKIPFQENINTAMADFYRYIEKEKKCKSKAGKNIVKNIITTENDTEAYKILCELIPLSQFEKEILPRAYDSCADEKLKKCKEIIIEKTIVFGNKIVDTLHTDERRKRYCVEKLEKFISAVVEEAELQAYKSYVENLKDASVEVDSYTIGLFSDRFNRDVYFIDASTRMPYQVGGDANIKNRKSLIVMWVGGIHYEIVGRLLPGNRIQREFLTDDPLVKRINTFLFRPETVVEQYPNLVPYLPKEHREKLGIGSAHSRSNSASPKNSNLASKSASPKNRKMTSKSTSPKNSNSRSNSASPKNSNSTSRSAPPKNSNSRSNSASPKNRKKVCSPPARSKTSPKIPKSPRKIKHRKHGIRKRHKPTRRTRNKLKQL